MKTFRRLSRMAALTTGALLLPAAALVATGTLAGAAAAPTAAFVKSSSWDTGYTGQYTITAGSSALSGGPLTSSRRLFCTVIWANSS